MFMRNVTLSLQAPPRSEDQVTSPNPDLVEENGSCKMFGFVEFRGSGGLGSRFMRFRARW